MSDLRDLTEHWQSERTEAAFTRIRRLVARLWWERAFGRQPGWKTLCSLGFELDKLHDMAMKTVTALEEEWIRQMEEASPGARDASPVQVSTPQG
jgi:hypothetical protein